MVNFYSNFAAPFFHPLKHCFSVLQHSKIVSSAKYRTQPRHSDVSKTAIVVINYRCWETIDTRVSTLPHKAQTKPARNQQARLYASPLYQNSSDRERRARRMRKKGGSFVSFLCQDLCVL